MTTTIDASTMIQLEIQRQRSEAGVREAGAAISSETSKRADAEVDSWPTDFRVTPRPNQSPDQRDSSAAAPRTPVSFEPQNADEMWRYAQMLARSTLLPKSFYGRDDKEKQHPRIADVHFVLMKGQALKLHPQVSIGNINVIEGKAEIGASLMVALCLRSGLCEYFEMVKSDDRSATFVTKRIGGRREIEFTYTIEEAEQMGLLDKGRTEWAKENNQWRKQSRTMLRRRCQSMLAREVYPDIVMGLYDHGELAEMREREMALGVDPDRVIPTNGLPAGEGAPDDFKRAYPESDPLKARLVARRQQVAKVAIEPRRCSACDSILDSRDSDPCIGCRPDPT